MTLDTLEVGDGITRVNLNGRLDIAGAAAIDLRFAALASGDRPLLLIDLSQVSFLASVGIRTFFSTARTVKLRRGRMVLLSPTELVARVLESAAVDTLIPVFNDAEVACEALRHPA